MSEVSGKKRKSSHGEVKDRSKKRKVETAPEPDPAERSERKKEKKRKREVANGDSSLIPEPAEPATTASKKSKTKKTKKEKQPAPETIAADKDESRPEPALSSQQEPKGPKESKTKNKAKNKTKPATPDATNGEQDAAESAKEATSKKKSKKKKNKNKKSETNGAANGDSKETDGATAADGQAEEATKTRFIVFIGMSPDAPIKALIPSGNLPFTATKESIAQHFQSVSPQSIRLLTHKDTGKSKGCAFVEFNRYDHMKTCLKLFHLSSFEDGLSAPRKINVDLT
jgi:nucleolar protein 6